MIQPMTASATPPHASPLAPDAADVGQPSPRPKPQRETSDTPSKRSRRRFDDIF